MGLGSCRFQIFSLPLHHPPRVVGNAEVRPMSVRGAGSTELWELGSVTIVPPQFISNENRYSDKLKVLIYKCKE